MTLPSPDEKPRFVRNMFAGTASRYDLMNRLMTLGQDKSWRRHVIEACHLPPGGKLLDVATGTGDIALEALRMCPDVHVTGADFTHEMMRVGQSKAGADALPFVESDALCLPFADDSFDAACSGFLMRNVTDIPAAFAEQMRVVRSGGPCRLSGNHAAGYAGVARCFRILLSPIRAAHHRSGQQQQRRVPIPACLHPGLSPPSRPEDDHGGGGAKQCVVSYDDG